jgi:hypothetical protein
MIDKNTYVRIRRTILKPEERSPNLPEDTKKVPFKMWVKGFLLEDADCFDMVSIQTITGRVETGRLKESQPPYKHTYGDFVPELFTLRKIIHDDMDGEFDE